MKKVFIGLLLLSSVILISACGKDEITSASCSGEENNVMFTFDLKATNDKIDKVKMTAVFEPSDLGVPSISELDDETKEAMKKGILDEYGLEEENEGLTVNITFDENMTLEIDADLEVAPQSILEKVSFDFTGMDMSLERAKKDFEDRKYTCK